MVQKYMIAPLKITLSFLYRVSWSQNFKIIIFMFFKILQIILCLCSLVDAYSWVASC
jgi:hypothetical protein